jgi:hypothetical protein
MADDFGLKLESARACSNTVRKSDGATVGKLYRFGDKKIGAIPFRLGSDVPPLGNVSVLTRSIRSGLIEAYDDLTEQNLSIDDFVALVLMRVCNRPHHDDMKRNVGREELMRVPRLERLLAIIYTHDEPQIVDVREQKYGLHRTLDEFGVGAMRRVQVDEQGMEIRDKGTLHDVLRLPTTDAERFYGPFHAVAAYPGVGGPYDPYAALYLAASSVTNGNGYIERIARRGEVAG